MNNPQEQKSCGSDGFNFCFWAKLIVGIPAVFIVVQVASSWFTNPMLSMWSGALAGIAAVYAAVKIDKIPALQKKIMAKKD